MGECGCAWASLWLEHAPSIGRAIGPRQLVFKDINKNREKRVKMKKKSIQIHPNHCNNPDSYQTENAK